MMSIFKQIQLFLLLLLLVVNVFAMSIICLDFKLNQDFYVENFCINKEVPELHCEGKCHLQKTLKAVEKTEKQQIPSFQLEFTAITFFSFNQSENFTIHLIHNQFYKNLYFSLTSTHIFHPPSC